jgi:hypothetical protein
MAAWGVLIGLFLLIGLVIWLAPSELTLGRGIRTVYLHVGLIWAGLACFVAAGFLGVAVALSGQGRWLRWMRIVGWAGVIMYGAGIGMSMVASQVNWGAVFLQEPRMAAALNGLAIAIIVQIVISWLPVKRLSGVLAVLLVILLFWMNRQASLVLHPPNPIGTSPSQRIQMTFFAMFVLCSLVAVWVVWFLRRVVD